MPQILCPLSRAAKRFGSAAAIISENRTISFLKLNTIVESTAQKLLKHHIKKDSRVAIISPSCPEYLIVLFALWRLGALGCPISPRFPKTLIRNVMRSIHCHAVLTQSDLKRLAGSDSAGKAQMPYFLNPAYPATILLTSGTTATPKAVLHTYANHYFNAKGSNENIPLQKGDRWLLSLPLYHVAGMGIVFRCLLAGATVVIPSAQETLSKALSKYRISHLSLVAAQLQKLLEGSASHRRLKNSKAILLGGSFIPTHLIQRTIDFKLPIYKSYGLTETASQVTTTRKDERADRLFTAGKVLRYRKLRIARDGEILVKGRVLFKRYLGRKADSSLTKDGWFKTGDMGYLRNDGYLVVTGRKDTMFVSGGENIYPEEIEKALLNDTRVSNAVIVPIADKLFGFRPVAFVQFAKNRPVSTGVLREILKRQIPKFKVPDRFYAWPRQLPANAIKFERRKLMALFKENAVLLK